MKCKNCDMETIARGKLCHHCGQKISTQRLTVKRFFSQHIINKYLYFDQNFTSTLKDIFVRPADVAWNYIHGKRKRYFNLVSLLAIVIGAVLILQVKMEANTNTASDEFKGIVDYIDKNYKYVFYIEIPILAFTSWLLFKRLKLNIIEHGIPALLAVIGGAFFGMGSSIIQSTLLSYYGTLANAPDAWIFTMKLVDFGSFVFKFYVFYAFVGRQYTPAGRLWRILLFLLIHTTIALLLFVIFIFIWTKGDFENVTTFVRMNTVLGYA